MTAADIYVLIPFLVLGGSAVIILLLTAFFRSHILCAVLASLACAAAFGSLFVIAPRLPHKISVLFIVDTHAVFYMGLIFAASLAVIGLSYGYFRKERDEQAGEFYLLILCAALGAAVLTASCHFISFFLGLEVLTVPLYVLIAYLRGREQCIEAGVKYLILAAASSAFLLFGMALIYAESGTMEFSVICTRIGCAGTRIPLTLTGTALLTTGIGFKLAVAPFHMWTSDVYEGAPAPVTAFIATVSKGAVFALLLRFFPVMDLISSGTMSAVFGGVAIASMFAGNLLALLQNNVKRILAYSSISHLGYLLTALVAGGALGSEAVAFYLTAYFITTLGAFGVITVLSDGLRDFASLDDFRGLFWSRPFMSLCFSAMMFSLAGIPLTAGFVGKFYIVAAGVKSSRWLLVFMLALNSVLGLYYYLRIIVAMYSRGESAPERPALPASYSLGGALVLAVLTLLLVWYGVQPSGLMEIVGKLLTGVHY